MGQNLGPLNIQDSYQSLVQISGSQLTDGTGSLISSVNVTAANATTANTASYALTATSASYATTASFALNGGGGTVDTGSLLTTASISDATITFTKGDASTFNITVDNVATAVSASEAIHAVSANSATSATTATSAAEVNVAADTANATRYVSFTDTTTGTDYQRVDGGLTYNPFTNVLTTTTFVGNLSGNATTATTATTASYAVNASTADVAVSASHAVNADSATTATTATTATSASYASTATSASHAVNADSATTATTATSASYATTASHALGLVDGLNINATSISASNATFTSASIGFLQTVTGSATIIGDAFILLNTSDATRYAGLLVEDSGSATPVNYTASWFFDSLTNDWNYEYTTTASTDYAVALFAPSYSSKGSPTYLTTNAIVKASGSHHLVESNISDDGSKVSINSNVDVTGSINATDYISSSAGFIVKPTSQPTAPIQIGGLENEPSVYFETERDGVDQLRLVSTTTLNSIVLNQSGSQVVKIDFGNSAGEIEASGDITLDPQGGQVVVLTGISASLGFTGSLQGNADTATSASYATTASLAINAEKAFINVTDTPDTGFPIVFTDASSASFSNLYREGTTLPILQYNPATNTLTVKNIVNEGSLVVTGSAVITGSLAVTGSGVNILSGSFSGSTVDNITDVYGTSSIQHIVTLTQAEYNAISASADPNTLYVIEDATTPSDFPYTGSAIISGSLTTIGDSVFSGSVVGEVGGLTIASTTASMDCSAGNFFTLTLVSGSDTHLDASNIKAGQTINVKLTQPGTGYGTISFSSDFAFPTGSTYTGSAASNAVDIVSMVSFDTSKLYANQIENLV